jgi:hypothetical protein
VTKVRFSHDHRFLLSIGGGDKAIIQWRHDVEDLDSSSDDEPDTTALQPMAGPNGPTSNSSSSRGRGPLQAVEHCWEDAIQIHPEALHRTPLQVRRSMRHTTPGVGWRGWGSVQVHAIGLLPWPRSRVWSTCTQA